LNNVKESPFVWSVNGLPDTLALRTRRAYDRMSRVYGLSSSLLHSRAHRHAVICSEIQDGMRILEVATGSGEMFRRLVHVNKSGTTLGVDLSPNMAALAQKRARRRFPKSSTHCQAVDARHMPFRDGSFDVVVCCYLLELLSSEDIERTVEEFHRVLCARGRLALVMIGEDTAVFNRIYKVLGKVAPAFWGRQVEARVPELIEASDFRIVHQQVVRQAFYPSRVLVARK
jgi:ubiquinone/menaquinone biosynthesis C-methylase UbiE